MADSASHDADRHPRHGTRIALPARPLMLWMAFAAMLVAGIWSAAVVIGSLGLQPFVSGMFGIAVTALVVLAGVLVMTPWKPRAIIDWMTIWLAGTVLRMLLTPIAVFLLYSAASDALAVKPLVLAVAATYISMLMVEAAVLARHMKDASTHVTK